MDITKIPGFKPSMGVEERIKLRNEAIAQMRERAMKVEEAPERTAPTETDTMDITKIPGFKPSMGVEERIKLRNEAIAQMRERAMKVEEAPERTATRKPGTVGRAVWDAVNQ